jgi:hypothetical protein
MKIFVGLLFLCFSAHAHVYAADVHYVCDVTVSQGTTLLESSQFPSDMDLHRAIWKSAVVKDLAVQTAASPNLTGDYFILVTIDPLDNFGDSDLYSFGVFPIGQPGDMTQTMPAPKTGQHYSVEVKCASQASPKLLTAAKAYSCDTMLDLQGSDIDGEDFSGKIGPGVAPLTWASQKITGATARVGHVIRGGADFMSMVVTADADHVATAYFPLGAQGIMGIIFPSVIKGVGAKLELQCDPDKAPAKSASPR